MSKAMLTTVIIYSTIEIWYTVDDLLSTQLTELCSSGRTEKLWVQYFKLVAIIRLFIRAERFGDLAASRS